MASGNKKTQIGVVQQVQQIEQAVAAAKEEVLNRKVLETLLKLKPEDLISADAEAEVIKGNANRPGCWIHSPAMVEFFAAADKRLTRVADWGGLHVKQVEKVHAQLIKGTKLVIIKAASVDDLTAIPVNRWGTTMMFNLISLLAEAGLTIKTGYRERFDVAYVPKESPAWPALLINLGQVKERRLQPANKKEESGQSETSGADAKKTPAAAGKEKTKAGKAGEEKGKAGEGVKQKAKATAAANPETAARQTSQGSRKKKEETNPSGTGAG